MSEQMVRARSGLSRWLVLGIVMAMVFALTAPVNAGSSHRWETVSGDSVPSDCNDGAGAGAIELTGDVDGCLTFYPGPYKCQELDGFDRYRERGTESFVGTLHGEAGEFTTNYTLDATYAPGFCDALAAGEFAWWLQLTGGCDHYVTGVSGAFENTKGLITFFDVVPDPGVSGASNFLYAGSLKHSR